MNVVRREGSRVEGGVTIAGGLALLALCHLLAACGRGPPEIRNKVLVIGLDGVRADLLADAHTPNIDGLIAAGVFSATARTGTAGTRTAAWASMLTGAWPEKHGVSGPGFHDSRFSSYPDFLTRLERVNKSLSTVAVLGWPPLATRASGGPLISDTVDAKVLYDGEVMGFAEADSLSADAAASHLANGDPDAVFVYLGASREAGRDARISSLEYRATIERTDARVGQLIDALPRRPTFGRENWLVLISGDYAPPGGPGAPRDAARRAFYLAAGPNVSRGRPVAPAIVDVAVTALTHMGVEVPPAWRLDGRVVGPALPAAPAEGDDG